jgi:2'-5' RNA ligase
LFLAAPLTEDCRHAVAALLREGVPRGLPGRVVRPENWHVTLRFLGQVGWVARDQLAAAVDEADLGRAFPVRWGDLGAFPRARRATVLWLGLEEGSADLERLAAVVEEAAEAAGFPPEERPFRAHLTLSRIRPHQDVSGLLASVDPLGVAMEMDRVVLYRSHLGRGGARYEVVEEFSLG